MCFSFMLTAFNIHHMYNVIFFEYISEYYTESAVVPILYISVHAYFKTIIILTMKFLFST